MQTGFAFLVSAYLGSLGKGAIKWVCVGVFALNTIIHRKKCLAVTMLERVRHSCLIYFRTDILTKTASNEIKEDDNMTAMAEVS